jgi:hypothetical protein
LAKHLRHERPYLFTFLYCPGLEATNNVAERVMRILVMIRKNWGGNRTTKGARTQAVLTSILCTAKQQDKDLFALIVDLLRSAEPKLLDLIPELTSETAGEEPAAQTPPVKRESIAERREFARTPVPVLLPVLAAGQQASLFSSA